MGYYGGVKLNPVFHVTAVTRRSDYLFQTITISGADLGYTDTAQLASLATEVKVWETLLATVREPVAVYATPSSGGISNVRLSLRQRYPGDARNALAAIMGTTDVKNVMVTDDDVDIFSDGQMDWVLATRFQGDKDLLVLSGLRTSPLDPSARNFLEGGAKVGYDLTRGLVAPGQERRWSVPEPPSIADGGASGDVAGVLAEGPASFAELMRRTGDRDGREVVRALGAGLEAGAIELNNAGQWQLVEEPGRERTLLS
jgi:2,5-furandicarboxylate decarboxylase 1